MLNGYVHHDHYKKKYHFHGMCQVFPQQVKYELHADVGHLTFFHFLVSYWNRTYNNQDAL